MTCSLLRISSIVPSAKHPALGHADDRVTQTGDEIHVMLDHAEGVAALLVEALDGVANGVEQRAVYAGADFVEEYDLGIDHHGAAKFEQLFLTA